MNYLKKEHFDEVLKSNKFNPEHFDHFERLSGKAVLYSTGSCLIIIYINTIVFDGNHKDGKRVVKLNTNNHLSLTSKKWINRAFQIFGNKYQIFQKDFKWYVSDYNRQNLKDYSDNMIITIPQSL